jgi:alkylated DNA repair protein alkB family protein 8
VTNASHESIFELFSTYGEILDVSLVPGKAFCFVTFANKVIAQAALEDVNGKKSLSSSEAANKTPVYVTYIDHIPDQFKTKFYIWTMSKMPDGLYLYPDFIDENEEKAILDGFKWPSDQDQPAGSSLMKNRQVQHFGKEFIYGSNSIQDADHIEPFPDHWSPIIQRSIDQGIEKRWPDQCTVNRYAPGHGIPAHVDNHACCDDTIVSLSLGSEVVMNFVDLDDPDKKSIPVSLKPRSLLAMTGRSRYTYSHGIVPRKADIVPLKTGDRTTLTLRPRHERVSLTFRKSTSEPCSCTYPQHCSSRMKENVDQIDQITASKLEKEHVHQVYEQIASHFSETRHKPWPLVMSFLDQHLSPGSILVDIGCGNGKYLGHHLDVVGIGFDYSRQLLTFVRQKGLDAIRSDALNIPLKSGIADALINIAVIHHLSTKVI